MVKSLPPFDNSLFIGQSKDIHFEVQIIRVFETLKRIVSTMLMVAFRTGILKAKICCYVANLKKQYKIYLSNQGFCEISKHCKEYFTNDKYLFTQPLIQFGYGLEDKL